MLDMFEIFCRFRREFLVQRIKLSNDGPYQTLLLTFGSPVGRSPEPLVALVDRLDRHVWWDFWEVAHQRCEASCQ